MGDQSLLLLIGLIIMTSLQNIDILGGRGLLMLIGSKFLIKVTRPQNIKMKEQCFTACFIPILKIIMNYTILSILTRFKNLSKQSTLIKG